MAEANVVWEPQPGSQWLFLTSPIYETLFTGTRGRGSTDGLLMDFAQHVGEGYGEHWRGILLRHEYKPLEDVVAKSKRWFNRIFPTSRFLASKSDYKWVFPDGEELLFRAFKRPEDYWDYHGHEYPWIGWDEITAWPDLRCYHVMKSCNRSSLMGIPIKYRATCNPYGPGHNAVKAYFIDPAPAGVPFVPSQEELHDWAAEFGVHVGAELQAVAIHGHYSENRALMEAQPDYPQAILQAASGPEQAKAWLRDDWDIVAGGMFDDLWSRRVHVLAGWEPKKTPSSWRLDRTFDWGSSKPFSVGWWAETDGTEAPDGRVYPRGTLFRIAEWYGWNGQPNQGLGLTDREIAQGIRKREDDMGIRDRVKPGPGDMPAADPGRDSVAEVMRRAGVPFDPADKGPGSRINGWQAMRRRFQAALQDRPEAPALYVFASCTEGFIRTVPTLPRDERNPDDVDTQAEDHVGDEARGRVLAPKRETRSAHLRVT